jgi:DNA-binding PadR family transcriptional regulator
MKRIEWVGVVAAKTIKRSNRTAYAVLGFLADGAKSGYEIKQDIEERASHFWSESFGQIYPVLKKLTSDEMIEKVDSEDSGKRSRQRYAITEKGLEELKEWIVDPAEYATIRSEFLLKLYFGTHVGIENSLQHLEEYKHWHVRRQSLFAKYMQILSEEESDPNSPGAILRRSTLEFGVESTQMALDWSQKTIDRLKETTK